MSKLILIAFFIFGLWLRFENINGANIAFDYDQTEDLFYTYKLAIDHKLPLVGRAIYGDPRLHHGVFFYYYNFLPFIASGGSPIASIYWNSFFNAGVLFIIFFLSKSMFGKNLPALLSALIAASSFEFIKFSSWLTIDTVAIFLVPVFYLGLWQYYKKKIWGLVLAVAALGLSIQTDLSFLYLLPVLFLFCFIFRPKIPSLKLSLLTLIIFLTSISTLILTEIKLNFAGVKTLLNFSSTFTDITIPYFERIRLFTQDVGLNFSNNLLPQRPDLGILIAIVIILPAVFALLKTSSKQKKNKIYFLLLYLFSPAVILFLGYHQTPWFLIGVPPAIALISGYTVSKLKHAILIIPVMLLILLGNTNMILTRPNKAHELFGSIYDDSSYLAYQLKVLDYTYKSSGEKPFAINAVTYPLYYNGMWAYLYNWYGKNHYGYLPGWLGGDQLHPYDLLPAATNKEEYFYMLISETPRIPEIYKNKGKLWAREKGTLIEEKSFKGFTVQKYENRLIN